MLKPGDKITIEKVFKRRTFWEWWKNKPRELETFYIVEDNK